MAIWRAFKAVAAVADLAGSRTIWCTSSTTAALAETFNRGITA